MHVSMLGIFLNHQLAGDHVGKNDDLAGQDEEASQVLLLALYNLQSK